MKACLTHSEVSGHISVPSSKSYTIRGLMCAALAKGKSIIVRPLIADDTIAAKEVLSKVGVKIESEQSEWNVTGDNFQSTDGELYCRDSATTLRFMSAICSLVPGTSILTVGSSLAKRPVKVLIDALRQLGVICSANEDLPPVQITGGTLTGGLTRLSGNISSQFVSALLLIAPLAREKVMIELTSALESAPYVSMTLECLEQFGIKVNSLPDAKRYEVEPQSYRPAVYEVEGDWSSASYFLAAGAMNGEVVIGDLNISSLQADRKIIDFLEEMGADVLILGNTVKVKKKKLKAIHIDLSDCIDLLPTMMSMAATAEGTSIFSGISRARLKESNRVTAMRRGLELMGVAVVEETDTISITGTRIKGATIDPYADHRIAMAFGILGLVAGDTIVNNAECVNKTYPGFWEHLKLAGGKINLI